MRGFRAMRRTIPNKGSINDVLSQIEVGEHIWIDTTKERYSNDMSIYNTPKSRRPDSMKDMEFTTKLITGVGSKVGEIYYLIRLERIK